MSSGIAKQGIVNCTRHMKSSGDNFAVATPRNALHTIDGCDRYDLPYVPPEQ